MFLRKHFPMSEKIKEQLYLLTVTKHRHWSLLLKMLNKRLLEDKHHHINNYTRFLHLFKWSIHHTSLCHDVLEQAH